MPRLLLAALALAVGCSDGAPPDATPEAEGAAVSENFFGVTAPYVRAAPSGGVSAVYFEIENTTATADTLVAVDTDVSDDVQIHQTTVDPDGLTRMERVDRIPVPAEASVVLEPGGYHIMLLDLARDLTEGDSLLVELTFSGRGTLTSRVPVRPLGDED